MTEISSQNYGMKEERN